MNRSITINTHSLHISRKAINKYGTTEGCPACNVISKREHIPRRIGYNHSAACRERINAEMQQDPEYRKLMHKHEAHHGAGDVEIFTEAQINERRHNLQKAIHTIEDNIKSIVQNMEQKLAQTMCKHLLAKMEVVDVHIPSRVTEMARRIGLRAGWALGITIQDYDGREWDFNKLEMRNRTIRKVLQDKPLLSIVDQLW